MTHVRDVWLFRNRDSPSVRRQGKKIGVAGGNLNDRDSRQCGQPAAIAAAISRSRAHDRRPRLQLLDGGAGGAVRMPNAIPRRTWSNCTMKTLSHTETSTRQALLSWGEGLASRARASMKPTHRAGQIAAAVAESGNPPGA